jgi:hypothetical protein
MIGAFPVAFRSISTEIIHGDLHTYIFSKLLQIVCNISRDVSFKMSHVEDSQGYSSLF